MLASAVKELLDGILCRSRHKTRSLVFSDSCRNRNILFKTPEWGDIYVFNLFLIGNYQDIILSTNMESHIYPKLLFSIYIYTLLVCLTAEPIGPKFLWDLTWPQGRFMDAPNYRNLCPQIFYSCVRFWKCAKKYYEFRKLLLKFTLYYYNYQYYVYISSPLLLVLGQFQD